MLRTPGDGPKALAMALPDETTALLKALCTGYSPRVAAGASEVCLERFRTRQLVCFRWF